MDSIDENEILHNFSPFLLIFRDGRIHRLLGSSTVPPSIDDPRTGVSSKDISDSAVSARLYLPKLSRPDQKLPVLVYYHGGGFCIETAFSPTYHIYLNSLASAASVLVVSVDYRRAPEHPIPAAYEDSWAALSWVASRATEGEPWLKDHGDLSRVFVGGDSAGANIAHHMAMRARGDPNINVLGALLVHPYFWGAKPIGKEVTRASSEKEMADALWKFVCPTTSGCDDPLINPTAEGAPSLSELGCRRVLVCIAENDMLSDRGRLYYDELRSSGWEGKVELLESKGENHVFHLFNPECDNANFMMKTVADFLNTTTPTPTATATDVVAAA